MNMNSDSALVGSGQMSREKALERKNKIYHIEDENVIRLCLKCLNLSKMEFEYYINYKNIPTLPC